MGCSTPRYKCLSLAALLLLGVVLRTVAKDFWEAKPFAEWSEPEAMKMLSESPWSRTLLVLGGTLAAAKAANRVTDLPSLSGTGAGRGTGVGQAGSGYGSGGDSVPLYVSWFSSGRSSLSRELGTGWSYTRISSRCTRGGTAALS